MLPIVRNPFHTISECFHLGPGYETGKRESDSYQKDEGAKLGDLQHNRALSPFTVNCLSRLPTESCICIDMYSYKIYTYFHLYEEKHRKQEVI
jgi:hypothetical protein